MDMACFASIWTRWTSVRKLKEGEVTADLFGFLTTEPNAVVGPIHPKAMLVILTTPEEGDAWMSAPPAGRWRYSVRCRTTRCNSCAGRERDPPDGTEMRSQSRSPALSTGSLGSEYRDKLRGQHGVQACGWLGAKSMKQCQNSSDWQRLGEP
jgi:hypothetical protein